MLVVGFVVNKFWGDFDLLVLGLCDLEWVIGCRVYGILLWYFDFWLDFEDVFDL